MKTDSAAMAPPASAGRALPGKPRSAPVDMADALQNAVSGLGTWRDKRTYSEYGAVYPLSDFQLRAMYRSSWMAGAIVTIPAEDMTREWVRVTWDGMQKSDQTAIQRGERAFGLKLKVRQGLIWAGVFGGAVAVIGIRGQSLDQPLVMSSIKKGSLQYIHVRDKNWVYPEGLIDRNEDSPNYGMPTYYRVLGSTARIHWSRIVRFEGRLAPYDDFLANNFWHDSELLHVMTAVKDFDGAVENVASMLWEAKIDVIKLSLAKLIAAKDSAAIQERYQLASLGKSNHKTLLLDKNEDYDSKTQSFGGVHDIMGDFIIIACGAARIPMVKLFGQSAPGMNSTGDTDLRLHYDHIAAEAEWKFLPAVTVLEEVITRNALGTLPEGFDVVPNPLWQVSEKDQAEIDYKRAQTDDLNIRNGVILPWQATREWKGRGTAYTMLEDTDVEMAKEMEEPIEPDDGEDPLDPKAPKKEPPEEPAD